MSAVVRHKHFKRMDLTSRRVFEKLIVEVRHTVPTCNHGPPPEFDIASPEFDMFLIGRGADHIKNISNSG